MPNSKVVGVVNDTLGTKLGGRKIPVGGEPHVNLNPLVPVSGPRVAVADLVGFKPLPDACIARPRPRPTSENLAFNRTTAARSRDQSTLRAYRERSGCVHQMAANADGAPPSDLYPFDIACWLRDARPTLRTNSWLAYKTACRQTWLTDHPRGWEEGVALLDEISSRGTLSPRNDGRPRKAKSVSPFDLALLVDWLAARRHKNSYGAAASKLLIATLHTGLRPAEWPRAHIEINSERAKTRATEVGIDFYVHNNQLKPGRLILAVDTLKTTNGHGHPHVRRLDITEFDRQTRLLIPTVIKDARKFEASGRYKATLAGISQILTRANETLWPRRIGHITLTSLRHQFLANAKSKLSRREVAALGGHSSTRTATQNYGRRNAGWSTGGHAFVIVLPIPDEASLAAVREPDVTPKVAYQPEAVPTPFDQMDWKP